MTERIAVSRRRFPELSPRLGEQLAQVPPSDGIYHPCIVTLEDGSIRDRVYLAEASQWILQWGVWPEDDPGKRFLPLERIREIADSPSRLPANHADKLYRAGESGMGYTIFTVCFEDGSQLVVGTGNAVDFIPYPEGQSPATVKDVLPHVGRNDPRMKKGDDYFWCLYEHTAASSDR